MTMNKTWQQLATAAAANSAAATATTATAHKRQPKITNQVEASPEGKANMHMPVSRLLDCCFYKHWSYIVGSLIIVVILTVTNNKRPT